MGERQTYGQYYVVGVITILYLGFVVLINIVSKKDMAYHITIGTYYIVHALTL